MKNVWSILVFTSLFLVVFGLLAVSDAPALVTGNLHPKIKHMLIGGSDIQTTQMGILLGFVFCISIIGMLCSFIYLGANNKDHDGKINHYLLVGFGIYFLSFVWLFTSHQSYIDSQHQNFVMGWPTPTAVMIYIMWSSPTFIVLVYIFGFRRWVLSEEDELRFREIVAKRNSVK